MKAKIVSTVAMAAASVLPALAQVDIPANTTITFLPISGSASVAFNSSSVQLSGTIYAFGASSIGIANDSTVTPYTGDLTGLSSTAIPDPVTGYLTFTGYRFDLATISVLDSAGDVDVNGTGTLVDLSGTYSATPASFAFSSSSGSSPSSNFSGSVVTLAPTPEPSTLALVGLGAGALALIRRRK